MSLETYLLEGVFTMETKVYIQNVMAVYHLRPTYADRMQNHEDDINSDEDIEITAETCRTVLKTRIGGCRDFNREDDARTKMSAKRECT